MKTFTTIKIGITIISVLFSQMLLASSLIPAPGTVEQYMTSSDIVVRGTIGDAVKVHTFYGYQSNAAELERLDAQTHMSLGIPMVDYVVEIDEVIYDSESVLKTVDSIILRVFRQHDFIEVLEEVEDSGNFLLFLKMNPDNQTFGFFSFGHKVNIDGEKPVFKAAGEEFDVLSGNINSLELISAVRNYK